MALPRGIRRPGDQQAALRSIDRALELGRTMRRQRVSAARARISLSALGQARGLRGTAARADYALRQRRGAQAGQRRRGARRRI